VKSVISSLLCERIFMQEGGPSTGKTTAIVAFLWILNHLNCKVLVVSHTNTAIDNLLIRLKETQVTNFVRVSNNANSVHSDIRSYVKGARTFEKSSDIDDMLNSTNIFASTCLSC